MAFTEQLNPAHIEFIEAQKMYFVASAPGSGRVNLSPKGVDSFRILGPDRVAYLDLTGSGNETAAHLLENGRMTLMFCSFDRNPLILRIYCRGRTVRQGHQEWEDFSARMPQIPGSRQIVVGEVETVQTSCGFGVPIYEFVSERDTLIRSAEKKGPEGILRYQRENNIRSIDGLPTGLFPGTGDETGNA